MTFDSRETSIAQGRPIRLYLFERGAQKFAYCSADREIFFQGQGYAPLAISDDGLRLTGQASADTVTVTAPASTPVAQLYRVVPPSAEIWLTIRDTHYDEPDEPDGALVSWIGSISGVRWPKAGDRCEISCNSLSASLKRPGLRLTWQRACPHSLYDHNCRVDPEAFRVDAEIEDIVGDEIYASNVEPLPLGWLGAGYIEWDIEEGEVERRSIESHFGGNIKLLGGLVGLSVGTFFRAYPGCAQTAAVCDSKFGNNDNYGGVKNLPEKSPFDGNPVY